MPTLAESQTVTIQQTPMELIMPSPATAAASTLNELLYLHDQAFIQCAYLTLLGRAADPEGFQCYLGQLRQGTSKIQILGQLRCSAEGEARECNLPGLDAAIRRYQWAQNPLMGWLVKLFYVVDRDSESLRKLRRIENQLLLLSDESNRRFNQMETALAGLHHLVVQQTQPIVAAMDRVHLNSDESNRCFNQMETELAGLHHLLAQQTQTIVAAIDSTRLDTLDISAITTIQEPEPAGLKSLSPRARDMYFKLKAAAARHAGRAA